MYDNWHLSRHPFNKKNTPGTFKYDNPRDCCQVLKEKLTNRRKFENTEIIYIVLLNETVSQTNITCNFRHNELEEKKHVKIPDEIRMNCSCNDWYYEIHNDFIYIDNVSSFWDISRIACKPSGFVFTRIANRSFIPQPTETKLSVKKFVSPTTSDFISTVKEIWIKNIWG